MPTPSEEKRRRFRLQVSSIWSMNRVQQLFETGNEEMRRLTRAAAARTAMLRSDRQSLLDLRISRCWFIAAEPTPRHSCSPAAAGRGRKPNQQHPLNDTFPHVRRKPFRGWSCSQLASATRHSSVRAAAPAQSPRRTGRPCDPVSRRGSPVP